MEDITHQDSTITSCFQNLHTTSTGQLRQHEDAHDKSPSSASTTQSDSLPPKTPVKMERENILTIPNLLCLRYVCINLKSSCIVLETNSSVSASKLNEPLAATCQPATLKVCEKTLFCFSRIAMSPYIAYLIVQTGNYPWALAAFGYAGITDLVS